MACRATRRSVLGPADLLAPPHRKLPAPMALLLVFGLPALLFIAIGRAAAPARSASVGDALRNAGGDLARGLRVCAMTSPQHLAAGTSTGR